MNLADVAILTIICLSALISLWRGFVREAFSLVTWVAAFLVARLFGPGLEVLLEPSIDAPSLRMLVAFGSLFVATLILGSLLSYLFGALVRMTGLSGTDRVLGMVFGAVRGMVVVIVLVMFGGPLLEEDQWWQESRLVPQFAMMEDWTRQVAADLLHLVMNLGSDT